MVEVNSKWRKKCSRHDSHIYTVAEVSEIRNGIRVKAEMEQHGIRSRWIGPIEDFEAEFEMVQEVAHARF
ncbi:MAG: hypothetical protein BGO01_20770 [Armatimonadetes bacterium 55-13]|nr:hypothetical protein [Armatimonadota bacterium]OJU64546.1 MAG: hypothetical protein BGO01_20770 [Armatimonadetes bacterium 55-13]